MQSGRNTRRGVPVVRRAFSLTNLCLHENSPRLCKSPEIAFDVLAFLDRFSVDAVEISNRFFYDLIGDNVERLAWRSLQSATIVGQAGMNEVYICGVVPVNDSFVGYRRRQPVVRSISRRFDRLRVPDCLEFALSALFLSHVDNLEIGNYYVMGPRTRLIWHYAPCIRVKDIYCCNLARPVVASAFDAALLYSAFDRFASIQSITCSSCSTEVEDELRNLCLAKQVAFSTI